MVSVTLGTRDSQWWWLGNAAQHWSTGLIHITWVKQEQQKTSLLSPPPSVSHLQQRQFRRSSEVKLFSS